MVLDQLWHLVRWNKAFSNVDPSTSKSRSGWVIFYVRCPIIWSSKLQSQMARVRCHVDGSLWHHSHYRSHPGNEGSQYPSHLLQALCLLQSLWRQCGCFGTCAATQTLPTQQAHQRMPPPFPWACAKGAHQDLPSRNYQSDHRYLYKGSSTKWLCTSLCSSMRQIALQIQKWRNVRYYGVLKYLLHNYQPRYALYSDGT